MLSDIMKIVYSDKKTGKTAQAEVKKELVATVIGKKIDEVIDGYAVGLDGFKLKITGLSDKTGAPSRREVEGTRKTRPLLKDAPGLRNSKLGHRAKRLIRGNTISADTEQINTVIEEYGAKPLDEIFKPKATENKES